MASELPPEDQPDTVSVAGTEVPIIHDDDPRFEEEREAWSSARRIAQALHTADELLNGLSDADWRVRHESIPRIAVRAEDDPRVIDALMTLARRDPEAAVRDLAVMSLSRFPIERVAPVWFDALDDADEGVRDAARFQLYNYRYLESEEAD